PCCIMERGFRLICSEIDPFCVKNGLKLFKRDDKVHITWYSPSGRLQLLGRTWPNEDDSCFRMFLLNRAGCRHHRSKLLGYLIDQIRKILFRQHGPGRTAGCKKERQFPCHNLFHIVMCFGDSADVGPKCHFVHRGKSKLMKGGLNISRRDSRPDLSYKCRRHLSDDLLSLLQCLYQLKNLKFVGDRPERAAYHAHTAGYTFI